MPRTKERRKFIHEPSTHEIFICLKSMVSWSKILHEHGPEKEYKPFLKKLLDANYFEGNEEKLMIKKIASALNAQTAKATRWLHEIYDDIIDLNFDKPQLFTNNKITAMFYCRYFDSSATVHLGIDVMPREFETFSFFFIKAKVGTGSFWVSRVEYEVYENSVQPAVWLEGGILNRYREMAVEEGIFKGWFHFMDRWDKNSNEIDEILLTRLRR
jgi:hypothetical protein